MLENVTLSFLIRSFSLRKIPVTHVVLLFYSFVGLTASIWCTCQKTKETATKNDIHFALHTTCKHRTARYISTLIGAVGRRTLQKCVESFWRMQTTVLARMQTWIMDALDVHTHNQRKIPNPNMEAETKVETKRTQNEHKKTTTMNELHACKMLSVCSEEGDQITRTKLFNTTR